MKCSVDGCDGNVTAKGLCNKHYIRNARRGTTLGKNMPTGGKCLIPMCARIARVRGMCTLHYGRVKKHGDHEKPLPRQREALMTRIFRRTAVDDKTGCIVWTGHRNRRGYGQLSASKGNSGPTHRFVYEALVAPIPDGMFVLHRCDNPPCLNPKHLFLGTHQQNMADMRAKGRSFSERRPRGSANNRAKLDEERVAEIKRRLAGGSRIVDLAHEYAVHRTTISEIKRGLYWKHVTI